MLLNKIGLSDVVCDAIRITSKYGNAHERIDRSTATSLRKSDDENGLWHWIDYSSTHGRFYYLQGQDPYEMQHSTDYIGILSLVALAEIVKEQFGFDIAAVPLEKWRARSG